MIRSSFLKVSASLHDDRRPIFAAKRCPTMRPVPVSVRYVEEMLEATVDLAPVTRNDYLNAHGIDFSRVKTYLEVVKRFERSWNQPAAFKKKNYNWMD